MYNIKHLVSIFSISSISILTVNAQNTYRSVDNNPINGFAEKKQYTVGDISIAGAQSLDTTIIKTIFGLSKGQAITLPGDEKITKGIKAIWSQGLLEDLAVNVKSIQNDTINLVIQLKERPRFSKYRILGVSKNDNSELREKIDKNISGTRIISESIKAELKQRVKNFFIEDGYSNVAVDVYEQIDAEKKDNSKEIIIAVEKGSKTKINQINIVGNNWVNDFTLKRKMGGTKEKVRISLYPAYTSSLYGNEPQSFSSYLQNQGYFSPSKTLQYLDPYFRYNFFNTSKFDPNKLEEDKSKLISYYNSIGHRDAVILEDTVYKDDNPSNVNIDIRVDEGKKYYFGNIKWSGNTKYSDSILNLVLDIQKGDVYNRELLDSKLGSSPNMDVSPDLGSLYMDQGYLFFRANAVETAVYNDTIDFRIDLIEGNEAKIKRVDIKGNYKTNDYVLRRDIFTKPGNKFSRSDIIRSIRQLSQLGYIDPTNINPVPKPNPADNTVDIVYNVTEKPNDQIEAQVGYGGGIGLTGTLGLTLNNFSMKNVFKKNEWKPLPMGDGQNLSVRWQSNGLWYNTVNLSFTEPWLGGKKPIALTTGLVYTRYSMGTYGNSDNPNASYIQNYGANIVLSKRLKWPDNSFVAAFGVNYQNYFLKDYTQLFYGTDFSNGSSNNLNFLFSISRNTIDNPLYPRSGANVSLNVKFTPPFSYLGGNSDYSNKTLSEKFKWIEYHKYRFDVDWYQAIKGDLVLKVAGKFGYLGYYNPTIGNSPFERYQMGGDGMTGYNFFVARDVIAHRGYEVYRRDATVFNKYTMELRYPLSTNPNSTIYALAFFEAGNAWANFSDYNPFQLNRAAGLGIRMRLPMFGLLGFDYGFGFDAHTPGGKFSQAAKFSFMLGREPD